MVDLISAWERVLSAAGRPTADPAEGGDLARRMARLTESGLASPEAADAVGAQLGRRLVQAQLTQPAEIRDAVELLGAWRAGPPDLVGAAPALQREQLDLLVARMQGSMVAGHAAAVQQLVLAQQEAIHQAAIAARVDTERALRDSEARFKALFTEAAMGIGIGDVRGRILEVNESFQRMLGYSLQEFLDRPVEALVHPDDDSGTWADYAALVAGKIDAFRAEKPYVHKDGHAVWTHLTVSLVRDPTGAPLFQVAMVEDITDRRRLQQELLHQATHDALTGLPNRALFLQRLDAATASPEPGTRVAVLFMDLDSFKFVNDSRGHLVGDQVLVAVARRLAATAARHRALLARLAGDEFVVLLTGPPHGIRPVSLADDLLAALDRPIRVEGQQPVHVRASIGVVQLPSVGASPEELLRAADLALHAAKEDGKGRVVVHDPTRTARQLSRFRIATDLPRAVDHGELALAYQPLVRLDSGRLHGVEALLRWNHPQLGEVTPEAFVPIAEESSAILTIGAWVLDQACRDLSRCPWPAVNINVSVRQLYSPTLVQEVRRALAEAGLEPERLRIEVTESVIMHTDVPGPLGVLRALADLGVRIVMDDFGTGYSNLAALRRFPLHELKLAATFLEGMHAPDADRVDVEVLSTVVNLAHTLGLTVTAEGVETAAQDAQVRLIGCDIGQGRYYAAPAPAPAVALNRS